MRLRHIVALSLLGLPALGAQSASPPSGRCRFQFDNTPNTRVSGSKLPSGNYNNFIGGGVVARCPAQNIVLRSDSLEAYGDEGRLYFVGHVDYSEPRLKLKSDQLTYFQRDERLLAVQNVDARLPSGSTIRGPTLEFFRAVPRVRPQQSATASGRPTITLVERDSSGKSQPPVTVTGNTVWLQGDSVVVSQGNVVVVRPELTATGDSLYGDSGHGLLRLMRTPRITGTKGRPFTLSGGTIDLLTTKQRKLDRVLAKDAAEAHSEDLTLKSDSIDLRVSADLLQRAISWGKSRAHATSQSQSIVADSIDVLMPNQKVREMHALRLASAEGDADTTKFRTTEKDRITGDTIIAHFDTAATADTGRKIQIRQLIATGIPHSPATSLQHLPPKDTSLCVPAINYVRGRVIHVAFTAGKIDSVSIVDEDLSGGVHLEPAADTTSRGCHARAAAPPSVVPVPAQGTVAPADPRRAPRPAPPPAPDTNPAAPAPATVPAPKRP